MTMQQGILPKIQGQEMYKFKEKQAKVSSLFTYHTSEGSLDNMGQVVHMGQVIR